MDSEGRDLTTTIILHRFAADHDGDGATTFDEAVRFFTQDPEGVATVALGGTYAEKLPTIERWRAQGVPAAYAARGFVPYHFLVDATGQAARMLALDLRGAHAGAWNDRSIAVCCLGNFDKHEIREAQEAACVNVLRDILTVYPRLQIISHDEAIRFDGGKVKGCAGRFFPLDRVRLLARKPG